MSDQELVYEKKGSVGWLTINREARRNAISLDMIELLSKSLDDAEKDENIRVICLTAAGDKVFCSGADLATSFESADYVAGARKYAALLKQMAALGKPIVARVNGHCLAGGMGLMLSCDIVYAREGIKIGTPEVNVGLFPMMIGALIFRNAVRKKALEMIYTARTLSAGEAEEMGLITRALPADKLDDVVDEALNSIAGKAPVAVKLGKQALARAQDMSLDEGLDHLCEQLGKVVATEDAREGLSAFLQKRTPVWKGR
ncbi:MAG: enoyl-CoA hydratase/isomerase family protein [Desulfomonile sp.]|nr:enoyl-CoA hydratase/isomerase family protein [Desulfomonile sp.]